MRFRTSALKLAMIVILLNGCLAKEAKDDSLKVIIKGKSVEIYLPSENENLSNPILAKHDIQMLEHLSMEYYNLIRKGSRKAAVDLFLSDQRSIEDSIIPRDIERARENLTAYMPISNNYIWYQNGKLWPRKEAVLLKNDEIERLIILSSAFRKALIIKTKLKDHNTGILYAVYSDNKYYLLP